MQASGSTNEQQLRAFHVRSGEHGLAARIDRWLIANRLAISEAPDPYHACVELAENSAVQADLVFVGLDWLSDDELSLLGFVRDTWKNCVLVAYSDDRSRQILLRDPLTCICREPAQLAAILSASATDLIQRIRSAASTAGLSSRPQAGDRRASLRASAPPTLPKILDLPVAREQSATLATSQADNFVNAEPELRRLKEEIVDTPTNPTDLVSREELAALLNTYFR